MDAAETIKKDWSLVRSYMLGGRRDRLTREQWEDIYLMADGYGPIFIPEDAARLEWGPGHLEGSTPAALRKMVDQLRAFTETKRTKRTTPKKRANPHSGDAVHFLRREWTTTTEKRKGKWRTVRHLYFAPGHVSRVTWTGLADKVLDTGERAYVGPFESQGAATRWANEHDPETLGKLSEKKREPRRAIKVKRPTVLATATALTFDED